MHVCCWTFVPKVLCVLLHSFLRVSLGFIVISGQKQLIRDLRGKEVGLRFQCWLTHCVLAWIIQGPPGVEKPLLSSLFMKPLLTHSSQSLCLNCLSFEFMLNIHPYSHLSQAWGHEDPFLSSNRTNWFRAVALKLLFIGERLHFKEQSIRKMDCF